MKLDATIKLNAYEIIARAVETGVGCGYRRAHKHISNPTEDVVTEEIYHSVMGELCDLLNFGNDGQSDPT